MVSFSSFVSLYLSISVFRVHSGIKKKTITSYLFKNIISSFTGYFITTKAVVLN